MYCGREWLNKLRLFDHRSKGCPDVPIDPRTNKPICIPVLPNLTIAQLSKVLKRQIENNDASLIQLKLRTQIDVDAKTTLEKTPINGEHVHVQVCNFKTLKELLPRPCYSKHHKKGLLNFLEQRVPKIKCGAIAQKATHKSSNDVSIMDVS